MAAATDIEVRAVTRAERASAGGVAARALRDDPLLRFLHGDNVLARARGSYEMFVGTVRDGPSEPLAAFVADHVIGVVGAVPPDHCFVGLLTPEWLEHGAELEPPCNPGRLNRVLTDWASHHVQNTRHWHVGPVGVEPGLQGLGIGSKVLAAFCERMDHEGEIAWLETSKPENVVFYRRAGFEVMDESDLYELHTWFMRRDPR